MSNYGEKNVAITGIGMSEISRGATKSALDLTIDAAMEAIECAGLTRGDIDGISTYPGDLADTTGFSPVGIPNIQDAMRLKPDWYSGAREVSGQQGAFINAIAAISAGLCRHVLVFRTVYEASARKTGFVNSLIKPGRQSGVFKWWAPYHAYAPLTQQAPLFQRYVHDSGITEEQIAQIALSNRRHAQLNPKAVMRSPLTLEQYLASPIISSPVRKFDADLPIDGSCAMILSRLDCAKDCRRPVIRFEAVGSAMHYRHSWTHLESLATHAEVSSAAMLWNRTDLKPKDVDVAQLYDGFSFHTLQWIEALGFCGRLEAGDFIDGGKNIALDGILPLNTDGGALSAGRIHGFNFVHEACVQLWGDGGERQVADTQVAVTSAGGGPLGGCLLLVRD